MTVKQSDNSMTRKRFNAFCTMYYNPELKTVAKAIGVSYFDFVKWTNAKHDYGIVNLSKIKGFLNSKGM